MKLTAAFLVLLVLVLMPEPTEGFFHLIAQGVAHLINHFTGRTADDQVVVLDKRSLDYRPGHPPFN